MLDLFLSNKTPIEQLDMLRADIKDYQSKANIDSKKTKIKLFYGDIKYFNTGILVITDPPKAKFFESAEDKLIINILNSYDLNEFFITYNYLIYGSGSTKDIKNFSYYIKKLTDIINPKLIVCMGESSQFCFFKKKFMMSDYHGKQIGDYETIPIMTTYPIWYYEEKSKFEDHSYKEELRNKDWYAIKKRYEESKC